MFGPLRSTTRTGMYCDRRANSTLTLEIEYLTFTHQWRPRMIRRYLQHTLRHQKAQYRGQVNDTRKHVPVHIPTTDTYRKNSCSKRSIVIGRYVSTLPTPCRKPKSAETTVQAFPGANEKGSDNYLATCLSVGRKPPLDYELIRQGNFGLYLRCINIARTHCNQTFTKDK